MRAIRTWGSVRGVLGDRHPYRDLSSDGTRAPTQGPEWLGAPAVAPSNQTRWSLTYCGRKMVLTTGTTFWFR